MGAADFYVEAKGKNAATAFSEVTEQARWEHGHGGYSGTIAEKHDYTLIRRPDAIRATTLRRMIQDAHLLDYYRGQAASDSFIWRQRDETEAAWKRRAERERKAAARKVAAIEKRYAAYRPTLIAIAAGWDADKWGPAAAIEVERGTFAFFGYSSS